MTEELVTKSKTNYKCYDLLKELYDNNSEFKSYIDEGIKKKKIFPFKEEIWEN